MNQRVIVIGAGITGTLTAVRLAREGHDVRLLEARHIGAGSSSRTAAGIRQQFSTPETVLGMRYSVDVYRDFPAQVGGLIVPIVENGYLFLLRDGTESARARVAMQQAHGLAEVEYLDPSQTLERFPFVDEGIAGATWCPSDGFLRPEVVYGEAASSLRARGVPVHQNSPVTEARHRGGRLVAVRAGADWHEADVFVDATNAWSPRTAQVLGAHSLPVAPIKRYLWFLARAGSMSVQDLLGMPMVVTPDGAYCHPENGETLMAGWAQAADPQPDFSFEDQDRIDAAHDHRSGVDSQAYATWFALAEFLPPVAEFGGVHATTCGFYGVTPDHNPFMGFDPMVPNLIRLVGFSGHGAMFGPFSAHLAAHLVERGPSCSEVSVLGSTVSLAPFALDREFAAHEAMVI